MRHLFLQCLVAIFLSHTAQADTTTNDTSLNTRLNTFIADLKDRDKIRHYELGSKQSAIHKMLESECMAALGFNNAADSDPVQWYNALNGEFAYCQDHHIKGIDPPCPSEDIVESSVNNSCSRKTYNQIDWGHSIMYAARKKVVHDRIHDPADSALKKIEATWSHCMAAQGYDFKSRVRMFSTYGSPDLSDEERAALPNRDLVDVAAELCYEKTQYRKKLRTLLDSRSAQSAITNRKALLLYLERYENAEREADTRIKQYCLSKRGQVMSFYRLENYSEKMICEHSD